MTETLHPEELVTTVLLIRHGHTEQTEGGRLYSDPNAQLTEKGHRQAEALGVFLPNEKPEVLLSSPSKRVRTTAEIISQALAIDVTVADPLYEWQVGKWNGRTYLDIKKSDPELYGKWSVDPIRNAPPDGESIADLYERAGKSIEHMVAQYAGKKIAIVTHAEIIRSILVRALGMPVDNFWRLAVPTGSISKVDFSSHFATVHYTSLVLQLNGKL